MFKQVYTGLFIGSTILGITGLVQIKNTQALERDIALAVGAIGTSSALTTVGLGMAYDRKKKNQEADLNDEIQKTERVYKEKLAVLDTEIQALKATIKSLEASSTEHINELNDLKNQLNTKAHQYLTAMAEKDLKVSHLQAITTEHDTRITDFLEDCRLHVISFLSLRNNNLDGIQSAISQGINQSELPEATRESLGSRLIDIKKLRSELVEAIAEIKTIDITSFKTVLDFIFEFDNKFLNVKVRWKDALVKKIKVESTSLREALDDSMPKPIAFERFTTGMDEVDQRITEKYEALLLNNNSIHAQLLNLLEQRNLVINDLQQSNDSLMRDVAELQKPLQAVGTSDYAVAANRVANYYYENYGYKLDVLNWVETEVGFNILFATRRNPGLTETELLPHNTLEQLAAFTNALHGTLPKLDFNYQHSLLTLEIILRKPAKKKSLSETDISKLWIPASKFEDTVKGWSRVRLTGGSESGKSPTAENLAVCILKNRPGTAKLFNPQHDSVKNYWTVPVVGTSHNDSEKAIAALAKQVDARSNGQESRDTFQLYIFDEIDSTMSHTKGKKSVIGSDVNFIIKQASHQNLGAIFIGQNANVSEYPGMDRSDWNSAVNVHIGSNAYDALTNSNLFTNEQKDLLKEKADKLSDFCSSKNDELMLDKSDPNSYRFALVVEPNKKPYFIELPSFGTYTYDLVFNSCSSTTDSAALAHPQQLETLEPLQSKNVLAAKNSAVSGYVGSSCPSCSSTNLKRNGKQNGSQRYVCKDCGKHFTE